MPGLPSPQVCAMISLTGSIDSAIFNYTFGSLISCAHTRYNKLCVVDVHMIHSIVALLPLNNNNEFFILEELGLSVYLEPDEDTD